MDRAATAEAAGEETEKAAAVAISGWRVSSGSEAGVRRVACRWPAAALKKGGEIRMGYDARRLRLWGDEGRAEGSGWMALASVSPSRTGSFSVSFSFFERHKLGVSFPFALILDAFGVEPPDFDPNESPMTDNTYFQ